MGSVPRQERERAFLLGCRQAQVQTRPCGVTVPQLQRWSKCRRLRSPASSLGHPSPGVRSRPRPRFPHRSLPTAPQSGSVSGGGALARELRQSEATRADILLREGNQDVHAGGLLCGDTGTRRHLRAQERGLGRPAPPMPTLGHAANSWDGKECLQLVPWAMVPCHGGRGWQVIPKQAGQQAAVTGV